MTNSGDHLSRLIGGERRTLTNRKRELVADLAISAAKKNNWSPELGHIIARLRRWSLSDKRYTSEHFTNFDVIVNHHFYFIDQSYFLPDIEPPREITNFYRSRRRSAFLDCLVIEQWRTQYDCQCRD